MRLTRIPVSSLKTHHLLHSGAGMSMRLKSPQRRKGPIIGLTAGLAILVSSPGAFAQAAETAPTAADAPAAPAAATAPAAADTPAAADAPAASEAAAAPAPVSEEVESVVVIGT